MKVTNIRTLVVNAEMRNWVFCKVETDQPGLFGWGEGSLEWKTRAVVGVIEDLAPMVIGEDPRRIEHIYQKLYRQSFWRLGVIGMSGISAIEQALWDIKGKRLGVPVYELLGGQVREKVRVYAWIYGDTPGELQKHARERIAAGYTAIKMAATAQMEWIDSAKIVQEA